MTIANESQTPDQLTPGESPGAKCPSMTIFATEESCQCLQCESEIPKQNIAKNLRKNGLNPTTQEVLAYCEHCQVLYRAMRELSGGNWVTKGKIEIVSDISRENSFLRRLDFLKGDRQIA